MTKEITVYTHARHLRGLGQRRQVHTERIHTGGVAIPIRVGGKRVQESTAFVDLAGQTGCLRMKILFRC